MVYQVTTPCRGNSNNNIIIIRSLSLSGIVKTVGMLIWTSERCLNFRTQRYYYVEINAFYGTPFKRPLLRKNGAGKSERDLKSMSIILTHSKGQH